MKNKWLKIEKQGDDLVLTKCDDDAKGNITIPDGVTRIGDDAFRGCSGLTSITIPESVTSIGDYAFNGWSGMTSITIPKSVTHIGKGAFRRCSGLTSITIPKSVTHIGKGIFYGCVDLTSICVEKGNMVYDSREDCNAIIESKNNILIAGCQSTNIPDEVTVIGDCAFYGCSGLTSITIPDGVTRIGDDAFCGCSGLTSITIPDGVTRIGDDAFRGCSGLTSITIPDGVTRIGNGAFYWCSGLTSITIPDGVTHIGDSAFCGCSGLISITIPKSVTNIGEEVFSFCEGLTSIYVEEGSMVYDSRGECNAIIESENNILIAGCKNTHIPDGVIIIDESAFYGCSSLKYITLPQSVTFISARAFGECQSLRYIAIPKGVVRIDKTAFEGCPALQYLAIPDGCTYGDDASVRPESSPNAASATDPACNKPRYSFMDIGILLTGLSSFLLNLYLFVPVFVKKLGVQFTLKEQIYMSKETETVIIPSSQWCMMILALGLALTSIRMYFDGHHGEYKVSTGGATFAISGLIMGAVFIVLAATSLSIPVLSVFLVIIGLILGLILIYFFLESI